MSNNPNSNYILSMQGITKIYENGFIANRNIDFNLKAGEIHGLLGENGAGKTTLMKILFGHEKTEMGKIFIDGSPVNIESPIKALDLGIGMVHQHFMLVDSLSVAENIVLGIEPRKHLCFFDKENACRKVNEISSKYNLHVDPEALIRDLSVGSKQKVEILKILCRGVRILILDEPTAVLTPQETDELFTQLIELKKQGLTIVFISHKLNEVKQICDRITVLRHGEVSGTADIGEVSIEDISHMMVGHAVPEVRRPMPMEPGKIILSVRNVSYIDKFGLKSLNNVSFDVREGQILGIAGVEGNGQAELTGIITRLIDAQEGTVTVQGRNIAKLSIAQLRKLGVSMVHEDRMTYGTSSSQSIFENFISDRHRKHPYSRASILNFRNIQEESEKLITDYTIKCDGPKAPVKTLSGGNIQKIVVAREFSSSPKLVIASHPTRGIDIGATALIQDKLVSLRENERTAILLFSADLNELLNVSDAIALSISVAMFLSISMSFSLYILNKTVCVQPTGSVL